MIELFGITFDYTLRNVVFGAAILGIVGGVIGCLAVLRQQSLLSDAVSHAALPGICVAFLATGVRSTPILMAGAAVTGLLGALLVLGLVRSTRLREDAALGIVLSTFFGFGTVLLTRISRTGDADQAGLSSFLFGQAASLVATDVVAMAVLGTITLVVVAVAFKEFKASTFDPGFAASIGLPVTGLSILLTLLIVSAIVIGLQAVGVILMVTVLVAPALAARQWTTDLGRMMILAGFLGGASGITGALLSATVSRLPTGPTIVLIASAIVIVSVLFAPGRGVAWGAAERRRTGRRVRAEWADRAERHQLPGGNDHLAPQSSGRLPAPVAEGSGR
ncbi:MAG TPA: metal ABC transporter permease [Thermomicrobiales bacterium]|nr:metal ABC transporter permease [Thermomicrobiales bacterium]